MAHKLEGVTGVLVAGGKSRRFGQDKRFVKIVGQTLFDRSLALLDRLFTEVIVAVAERTEAFDHVTHLRVVEDLIPEAGSLGGLYTGLFYATHARVFAIACDMPFLNVDVIRYLVQRNPSADVVMAELSSGPQPLHAVFSKRCLPILEAMAREKNLKIQELRCRHDLIVQLVPESDLSSLDPRMRSFYNINTPAELELAKQVLAHNTSLP